MVPIEPIIVVSMVFISTSTKESIKEGACELQSKLLKVGVVKGDTRSLDYSSYNGDTHYELLSPAQGLLRLPHISSSVP